MKNYKKTLKYLPIIILTFIMYKVITEKDLLSRTLSTIYSMFVPFIWAFCIAYLLNPLLIYIEKKFNLSRNKAMLLVYIIAVFIIAIMLLMIIPPLITSITDIANEIPSFGVKISDFYKDRVADVKSIKSFTMTYNIDIDNIINNNLKNYIKVISEGLQGYIVKMSAFVLSFASSFIKFIIGFIVSVYLLKDKEKFMNGISRLNRCIFGDEKFEKIKEIFVVIDEVFSNYLIGKTIDSLVIGLICFFGLLALGIKYAVLFAVIVAITNMIPYFGPFIGAVPAVIITLFMNPSKTIWVATFIFILQQLDGYVIGPKIIGDSVGTSPFWIIFSIVVGGKLFGLLGMLLGVPVITVIRQISIYKIDEVLSNRELE